MESVSVSVSPLLLLLKLPLLPDDLRSPSRCSCFPPALSPAPCSDVLHLHTITECVDRVTCEIVLAFCSPQALIISAMSVPTNHTLKNLGEHTGLARLFKLTLGLAGHKLQGSPCHFPSKTAKQIIMTFFLYAQQGTHLTASILRNSSSSSRFMVSWYSGSCNLEVWILIYVTPGPGTRSLPSHTVGISDKGALSGVGRRQEYPCCLEHAK